MLVEFFRKNDFEPVVDIRNWRSHQLLKSWIGRVVVLGFNRSSRLLKFFDEIFELLDILFRCTQRKPHATWRAEFQAVRSILDQTAKGMLVGLVAGKQEVWFIEWRVSAKF